MPDGAPPPPEARAADGAPASGAGASSAAAAAAPAAAEAGGESGWRPGARAELCGLEKFPKFNGRPVELLSFDAEKGRWKCLLPDGGDVNVRAENLRRPPGAAAATTPVPEAGAARSPRAAAAQRAETLLAEGRVYEARVLLSATAGRPPAAEAPLAARGARRSELVDGRIVLVDVPGRGKGYRAARPIARGDVLLFDTALVSSHVGPSSNEDLARQCRQLRDEAFLSEVLALQAAGQTEGQQQRLLAVLANNVFECTREPGRVALFVAASRFNHSCCPSAYVDATRAECVVRALRDIEEGEEVCVSYIPVSDGRTSRQESLHSRGIDCNCDRCEAEGREDPQLAVPCECGAAAFTLQEGSRANQTCERCMRTFDREEALHNLSRVSQMNTYMSTAAASAATPAEVLRKLAPLEALVLPGARNGVPPVHSAPMFLLNHLANLHHHVATRAPESEPSASLEGFARCKGRALEVFEAKHSSWTRQRDVDFFQALQGALAHKGLTEECRARWEAMLSGACQLCFGQPGVPAGLAVPPRR